MLDNILEVIFKIIYFYVFAYPVTLCFVWMVGGFLYVCLNELKKYTKRSNIILPPVTILVPCHNEENIISITCENLQSLDYLNYRVLFIDDASTDNTIEVIRKYIEDIPFFIY